MDRPCTASRKRLKKCSCICGVLSHRRAWASKASFLPPRLTPLPSHIAAPFRGRPWAAGSLHQLPSPGMAESPPAPSPGTAPQLSSQAGALPHGRCLVLSAPSARFVLHNGLREPPLGMGGFASVFAATYYGRPAAAKVVRANVGAPANADLDDDTDGFGRARGCLDNELRLLPGLRHPGILNYLAYQYLPDEGSHVMFVEEMAGGTLADVFPLLVLWQLPLSAATFLNVALQLVAALTYLHDNNVIHGDIKPSNVLLSHSGEVRDSTSAVVLPPGVMVKLADFGISVKVAEEPPLRGFSPGFIAPEYYPPAGLAVASPARDMYALGVLLFMLLVPGELADRLLNSQRTCQPSGLADLAQLKPKWPEREKVLSEGLFDLVDSLPRVVRLVSALLADDPAKRPTAWRVHATLQDEYHHLRGTRAMQMKKGGGNGFGTPAVPPLPMGGWWERQAPRRDFHDAAVAGSRGGQGAGGGGRPAGAAPAATASSSASSSRGAWPYVGPFLGAGQQLGDCALGPPPRMPLNLRDGEPTDAVAQRDGVPSVGLLATNSAPPQAAHARLSRARGRYDPLLPVVHEANEEGPPGGDTKESSGLFSWLTKSWKASPPPPRACGALRLPVVEEAGRGGKLSNGASGESESSNILASPPSPLLVSDSGLTESLDLLTSTLSQTTPSASAS